MPKAIRLKSLTVLKLQICRSYKKASKQAKKAVKERRIVAIIHADVIDEQQAKQHEKNANTTKLKEKLELARFKITDQLTK